jgi:hypothetical protein
MRVSLTMSKWSSKHRGIVLLGLMLILLLASVGLIWSVLDAKGVKLERDKKTLASLAQAKAALIGWSAANATMPGSLPCPDTNNIGSAGSCGASSGVIGRLPWKTLGLSDLRDGDGECLWYALSPVYRNTLAVSSRTGSNVLNSQVAAKITVHDSAGSALGASVNPVIAVIIAPRAKLNHQSRGNSSAVCSGNNVAANYLDTALAINNANGNLTNGQYSFIAGANSETFNDQLTYITAREFYQVVRKRLVKELLGQGDTHAGPTKYFDSNHSYPCPAATNNGPADCTRQVGFVNNSGMGLQYATIGNWLANNGWFAMAHYQYDDPSHIRLSLVDTLGGYYCDANADSVTCGLP